MSDPLAQRMIPCPNCGGGGTLPNVCASLPDGSRVICSRCKGTKQVLEPAEVWAKRCKAEAGRNAAIARELLHELTHLVRLMEPLEQSGSLDIPGLATLNGARAAIAKATR